MTAHPGEKFVYGIKPTGSAGSSRRWLGSSSMR